MPLEPIEPGSAQDWLTHARSDLTVARQPLVPGVLLETLCYHAQQAVEKSLKAVLVHNDIEFPYTHDIARLITIVAQADIEWPNDLNDAAGLTQYAVESRYPGSVRKVAEDDYHKAIQIAENVLAWAEMSIGQRGSPVAP